MTLDHFMSWPPVSPDCFGMHTLGFRDFAQPTFEYGPVRALNSWAYSDDTSAYKGLSWADIHVADGVFHWDVFDKWVADLAGREAVYTFVMIPAWVTPLNRDAAWADFVNAVVARAGGAIINWEMGNEPNAGEFETSPADLANLSNIAIPIIRAAVPGAVIISPAPQGDAEGWMREFLDAGGSFDVMAWHLYADPDPAVTEGGGMLAILDTIDAIRADYGLQATPLWITETSEHGYWLSGATQAEKDRDYIGQVFPIMLGRGVERVFWYAWGGQDIGELRSGTAAELNVAGQAWVEMRDWLNGARVSGVEFTGNVGRVLLERDGGYRGQIVWHHEGASSHTIPAGFYAQWRDLAGNVTVIDPAATSVAVNGSAILLET